MNELWLFISGNAVDAVLYLGTASLFLLSFGSLMAAWCSFKDETQYERRRRKASIDQGFVPVLEELHVEDVASIREKIEQKMANLLFLKHIAIKQTANYIKCAIMYAVLSVGALGIQTWHINSEIHEHEAPVSVVEATVEAGGAMDNIKVKTHENGFMTVTVSEPENNSDYEFVYDSHGEKQFEQKITHVPSVIINVTAILWLLMIWGLRYMRSVIG